MRFVHAGQFDEVLPSPSARCLDVTVERATADTNGDTQANLVGTLTTAVWATNNGPLGPAAAGPGGSPKHGGIVTRTVRSGSAPRITSWPGFAGRAKIRPGRGRRSALTRRGLVEHRVPGGL